MKRQDYLWIGIGVFGIAKLVYDVSHWTPNSAPNWWLIGIGTSIGVVLGFIPWFVISSLRAWRGFGTLFFVFFVGILLVIDILSYMTLSPAMSFFLSLYLIANSVGTFWYHHRSNQSPRREDEVT